MKKFPFVALAIFAISMLASCGAGSKSDTLNDSISVDTTLVIVDTDSIVADTIEIDSVAE